MVPYIIATMDIAIKLAPLTTISVEDFILNNVKPIVCLEKDVFDADYVISNDAFFSKFNAITFDFTYLFDVYSNGNVHTLNHIMSISHLNFLHTEPFNISETKSPKEVQLEVSLSFEEKRELKRIIKKWKLVFAWSYDDMP